jgi:hypothetical protein
MRAEGERRSEPGPPEVASDRSGAPQAPGRMQPLGEVGDADALARLEKRLGLHEAAIPAE